MKMLRYHDITKSDIKNGSGLRTVLWVAGCNHHCKGCQNPITWDPEGGLLFDAEAEKELFDELDKDYCSGLTLSGGDPLYPDNRFAVAMLIRKFRNRYGYRKGKDIWIYTGYTMNELIKEATEGNDENLRFILNFGDVIVDGPYIEGLRDTSRYWVGSDNQVIWKVDHDLRFTDGCIRYIPQPKEYVKSLSDEQHEKEKGCDC